MIYTNSFNLDQSEILFNELNHAIVNIYKTCLEEMGYDLYTTNNYVEYHNYLINNPIKFIKYEYGGFGSGDWVWVPDGQGEDINGKKIGVFGDSLTATHGSEISAAIQKMGGIAALSDAGRKGLSQSQVSAHTLCGGAAFFQFANWKKDWSIFADCDHVITELGFNDMAGAFASNDKNLSGMTSSMGKVSASIKQACPKAKIHMVGIMPFNFGRTADFVMASAKEPMKKMVASFNGDESIVKHIHSITSNKCASLGWHFIDPHGFSVYDKWHDASSKVGDGIHIASSVGYSTWWADILKNAFGGGHWEYRGGGSFDGTNNGSLVGTYNSRSSLAKALGFSSERPSKAEVDAQIVKVNVPGWRTPIECHRLLAGEVLRIYTKLHELGVKFEYTYCYSYRNVAKRGGGHGTKLSIHAFGAAIDINPKLNPWVAKGTAPPGGDDTSRGIVRTKNSPIVQAFAAEGWGWGASYGDFMHFSKLGGS